MGSTSINSNRPGNGNYSAPDANRIFVDLLVLQGSPFCNIDCSYCYLPNRSDTSRMSMEILEKTLARLSEDGLIGHPFGILWHAGEPLAVPVDYYEDAVEVVRRNPQAKEHARIMFQTNAMLINRKWCEFFKVHKVDLGVSLDGPDFIHDANRKTRAGKGTHAQVMAGIEKLQESKINFGTIAVISETSLDYPDEMFHFFLEKDCRSIGFNIEEIEGINSESSLSADGAEHRLHRFMRRFFELNRQDGFPLKIREFEIARERILNPQEYVNNEPHPFSMINVDFQGNFSTFSPEMLGQETEEYGTFSFGNVLENRFIDATSNPVFQRVLSDIEAGNRKCASSCYYFPFCQGGSPSNKYYENKTLDSTETMHCRSVIQIPVDIVRRDIYLHGQWPQKDIENRDPVSSIT